MRNIDTYIHYNIFEACCNKQDYSKHGYKYVLNAIDILINDGYLKLGVQGNDGVISGSNLSKKEKEQLQYLSDTIVNSSPEDFNNAIKSLGVKWNQIFKGTLSGYENGLSSKNKGNAFEQYFIDNYSKFENDIKKIVNYSELKNIKSDGGLNQRRPLTFKNSKIVCGNDTNDFNIGKTVTDVTLETDKGPIYLSLKYGTKVTFVNAGIKTLFNDKYFKGDTLEGDGKLLLDMLCIDNDKFRNVFTSYKDNGGHRKQKAQKETIDILDNIKDNKLFETFMKSVMGYGFILVHQIKGDNIEYIDLTSENQLNKFISTIKEAYIEYPKEGEAKRVDVFIKYDNIEFQINIRSKTGGIYPTHIMADYKFV